MEIEQTGMRDRDDSRSAQDTGEGVVPVQDASSLVANETESANDGSKPLRKIHPKLHSFGRYKMFSNHSSANDMPHTSTGV